VNYWTWKPIKVHSGTRKAEERTSDDVPGKHAYRWPKPSLSNIFSLHRPSGLRSHPPAPSPLQSLNAQKLKKGAHPEQLVLIVETIRFKRGSFSIQWWSASETRAGGLVTSSDVDITFTALVKVPSAIEKAYEVRVGHCAGDLAAPDDHPTHDEDGAWTDTGSGWADNSCSEEESLSSFECSWEGDIDWKEAAAGGGDSSCGCGGCVVDGDDVHNVDNVIGVGIDV